MANALTYTTLRGYAKPSPEGPDFAFERIHELSGDLHPAPDPRGAYAAAILFNSECKIRRGQQILPEGLGSDQVEDYLAGQAVKSVLVAEAEGRI
jgi:hypothetical protein